MDELEKKLLNILIYDQKTLGFYVGTDTTHWSSLNLDRCAVRTALENLVNTGYLSVVRMGPDLEFRLSTPFDVAKWRQNPKANFSIPLPPPTELL